MFIKIQLLPHYYKYVGLTLFLVGALPLFASGFAEGMQNGLEEEFNGAITDTNITFHMSSRLEWLLELSVSIGILLYFMAKDKVFDELHNTLRLEVINFTLVFSVVVMTVLYVFFEELEFSAYDLISVQMICFLIVRLWMRQNLKPEPNQV